MTKEQRRAYNRLWYHNNLEKCQLKNRQYARKNRQKRKEYLQQWQASPSGKKYFSKKMRTPEGRFNSLKTQARARGLLLKLTEEQYFPLILLPCHYCEGPLNPTGSGLDRLNSNAGYRKGNVVPCCRSCNSSKGHIETAGFKYPRTYELMLELKGRLR